jgi:hypothetical protein
MYAVPRSPQQAKYEARKMLLKRIKEEWGRRLDAYALKRAADPAFDYRVYDPEYGRLLNAWTDARDRARRYIARSIAVHVPHEVIPSRADRRLVKLHRWGLKGVWE